MRPAGPGPETISPLLLELASTGILDESTRGLRGEAVSELTRLLADLEPCKEITGYARLSNQIMDLVALMTQAKNTPDAYRAVLVHCRHAVNEGGRPAEVAREAASRLRYLLEDPALLHLVVERACTGGGLSSVQGTQVLITAGAKAVPGLLERLRSSSARGRERIVAILIAMGDRALPVIVEQLGDPDPDRVRRAARLLGRMQHPRAVEFLLDALRDPDPEMRREVARALAHIGTPRAIQGLSEAAQRHPEVADLVASCLGDAHGEGAIQALVGMLHPRARLRDSVKLEAIRSLGRLRSTVAIPTLQQVLDRRSLLPWHRKRRRALRVAAAQAITRIGGEQACTALSTHGRRGDPRVRRICRAFLERAARDA